MRIVHTCLRYPPATGGVETYIREMVERTRDIDASRDVRVLTSKMRTHGPITQLNANLLLDDPMYIQRLHHAPTPFISYPRLQALNYYIDHHKPDIIHGHSFWYQPADVAARFAMKHNIPFVLNPFYYENKIRHKATWQLYKRFIGRQTFAAATVVITISPFEQKLIRQSHLPFQRIELVAPGIEMSRFTLPKMNPFLKRHITGPVMLTVSRLAFGKGLEQVIQAMPDIIKQVPNTQLVMVGEDFGAMPQLKKQINSLGLNKHTHFLGRLNDEELSGAYQHADIFIHASHYEAFGIVLAEASASTTPIVARNSTAIPYVAPHLTSGLLFNSPIELITATVTLLTNENLRIKYGRQGRQHVQNNFNWDNSAKKMISIYSEIMEEKIK